MLVFLSIIISNILKEKDLKKVVFWPDSYNVRLEEENAVEFYKATEALMTSDNEVSSGYNIRPADRKIPFELVFDDGSQGGGWFTESEFCMDRRVYHCDEKVYKEIRRYIRYPKIVGADARIIKVKNDGTVYVRWKDEDLSEVFGVQPLISCKNAQLNQYTNGKLTELDIGDFKTGDDVTIDIETYVQDVIGISHMQKRAE